MSAPADGPPPVQEVTEVAKSAPRPRRSLFGWALLAVAIVLASQFGYMLWLRATAPTPPEVELSHADPDVAEAIEHAKKLVRERPRAAAAWGHLGMMLQAHGYRTQAAVCYAHAEKFDQGNPQWPYLHATCAAASGSDEVIPCLERAIRCGDVTQIPRLVLGETLLEQGRVEEAEAQFAAVLTADRFNARAYLGLGRVATARGDFRGSVEHLKRSIGLEKSIRHSYDLLAAAHHALGEITLADEVRREAGRFAPHEVLWPDPYLEQVDARETGLQATNRRANAYLREGRPGEAIALLKDLTQRRPKSASAWSGLGRMLVLCERPAEAIAALEETLRLDPNMAIPNYYLGVAWFEQGKYDQASKAFRRALELQPNYADAHYELGRTLDKLGDRRAAILAVRECLRYAPNSILALHALGLFLADQRQYEDALTYLMQAAKLAPEDKEIKRLLDAVQAKHKADRR